MEIDNLEKLSDSCWLWEKYGTRLDRIHVIEKKRSFVFRGIDRTVNECTLIRHGIFHQLIAGSVYKVNSLAVDSATVGFLVLMFADRAKCLKWDSQVQISAVNVGS